MFAENANKDKIKPMIYHTTHKIKNHKVLKKLFHNFDHQRNLKQNLNKS